MFQNSLHHNSALQALYEPVSEDFEAVKQFISGQLHSNAALINDIDDYIFEAGGKRLRPLLVLLTAHACTYEDNQHIILAAIIECLHTATLLHDDVVDSSNMRRGRLTANHLWGNASSVLVGDFIYSRAFQLMVQIGNLDVMDVLASATNTVAEGEVMQLMNTKNANLSIEQYMDIVYCKTAMLFEASSHATAVLAKCEPGKTRALQAYGKHLGLAFQLIDDALDYAGNTEKTGKNIGDDLAEGKATLPLIFLMQQGTKAQAAVIRQAIENSDQSYLDDIMEIIHDSNAIDYTLSAAKAQAELALSTLPVLPDSVYKTALINLAHFSVNRDM